MFQGGPSQQDGGTVGSRALCWHIWSRMLDSK